MPTKVQPRHTLSYQLREIVESRGLTAYSLGQQAEVDPGVVSRFLAGRRDIRLETADKLALALGVRLAELSRPVAARKAARPARAASRPGTPPRAIPGVPDDELILGPSAEPPVVIELAAEPDPVDDGPPEATIPDAIAATPAPPDRPEDDPTPAEEFAPGPGDVDDENWWQR